MRIGVVSDTHDNLSNVERIVTLFEAARVDRVVHTGDITQAKTLAALGRLSAPLVGVYGNNDLERTSLETAAAEQRLGFVDPPCCSSGPDDGSSWCTIHETTTRRRSARTTSSCTVTPIAR